jgi:amidohydrolase
MEAKKIILERIEAARAKLTDVAETIWNFSETGGHEFRSSALLMDELEKNGFTVDRGLTGKNPDTDETCAMPTAFKATYGSGEPVVGVMLEYDALPNGHSCGHNLIAAAGLGAAMGLSAATGSNGTIAVFGTPAEEGGAPGKTEMLRAGYFDELDAVMMAHPSDRWNTKSRFLSIYQPKNGGITYHGRAAHASSEPERGRSALDAVLMFCHGIEFLREHTKDGSRMHYVIVNGGDAPNIVPDFAKINIYIRSENRSELDYMKRRVSEIAAGAAMMADVSHDLEWDTPWHSPVSVPSFYELAEQCAHELDVSKDEFLDYDSFGSTDAGNVGLRVPLVHLDFKIAQLGTNWHSTDSAAASKSNEGMEAMITAAKIMALSLHSIMSDGKLLRKIKSEFERNKK